LGDEVRALLVALAGTKQVVVNLIRNAVDALKTMLDGATLIRLRAVLDGDDTIGVEVRDRAVLHNQASGIGMGLAICRSIIKSHDGRFHRQQAQRSELCCRAADPSEARGMKAEDFIVFARLRLGGLAGGSPSVSVSARLPSNSTAVT
jgi:K+-sensing histidine kinase KdpD